MHQENLFDTVLQAVQKDDLGEWFTRPDCSILHCHAAAEKLL